MFTKETNDKRPDGPARLCPNCKQPRARWRTDRLAEHLTNCAKSNASRQRTPDEIGESRSGP
jgi:hypothetical protein